MSAAGSGAGVTVVIPVHNGAKPVADTVQSVLAQQWPRHRHEGDRSAAKELLVAVRRPSASIRAGRLRLLSPALAGEVGARS